MIAVSSAEGGTSAITEGTNYSNAQDTTIDCNKKGMKYLNNELKIIRYRIIHNHVR
jgi:hypothetical protein